MISSAVTAFTTALSGFGVGLAESAVTIFNTAAVTTVGDVTQLTTLGEFGFMMIALGLVTGAVTWAASKVG